jgi:hypothetical protein
MEQYKKNMGADDANSPTATAEELKRMTKDEIAAETAAKDARKTEQAEEMKTLFKGRDERADKREGELEKSKETNTGMAFLEAGLAMMQSKGRGLAGIAQGAGVGAKAYAAGIDKIKTAQEKLDEARDRTEELRQNRSMLNSSEIRDAERGIRSLVAKGNRDQIAARAAIYGEKTKVAAAATASDIATALAGMDRDAKIKAANIAAAPGLERNRMQENDMAKARTEYGKLQAKVMADLSNDPKYTLAKPEDKRAMGEARLREALMNNPFLSMYASNIGFTSGPAGTIRSLDVD